MTSVKTWNTEQRSYWDKIAPAYDRLYSNEWSRREDEETIQLLTAIIPSGACKILDLAAGTGLGGIFCRQINPECEYHAVDISQEMIIRLLQRIPNATTFVLPISNLNSLLSESYDAVICLNAACSFSADPRATIGEVWRLLRPGGGCVLSFLNRWSLRRLIRLRFARLEHFCTRNQNRALVNTYTPAYAVEIKAVLDWFSDAGFAGMRPVFQSALGGVAEFPALWQANRFLSRSCSQLGHTINVVAARPMMEVIP